jgi:hypothetical protein
MKKLPYKQLESTDLDCDHQIDQSNELQTQVGLRRGLFQVDNQDALRALSWLLCNCEFSKKSWLEIEMRYELYSSPNA